MTEQKLNKAEAIATAAKAQELMAWLSLQRMQGVAEGSTIMQRKQVQAK